LKREEEEEKKSLEVIKENSKDKLVIFYHIL
jgi:hypothetical protein